MEQWKNTYRIVKWNRIADDDSQWKSIIFTKSEINSNCTPSTSKIVRRFFKATGTLVLRAIYKRPKGSEPKPKGAHSPMTDRDLIGFFDVFGQKGEDGSVGPMLVHTLHLPLKGTKWDGLGAIAFEFPISSLLCRRSPKKWSEMCDLQSLFPNLKTLDLSGSNGYYFSISTLLGAFPLSLENLILDGQKDGYSNCKVEHFNGPFAADFTKRRLVGLPLRRLSMRLTDWGYGIDQRYIEFVVKCLGSLKHLELLDFSEPVNEKRGEWDNEKVVSQRSQTIELMQRLASRRSEKGIKTLLVVDLRSDNFYRNADEPCDVMAEMAKQCTDLPNMIVLVDDVKEEAKWSSSLEKTSK
ncbi:hypothetical protein K402DRAFT_423373 [Aulographum hederae CBS 113979]|uniref:Uncharacterized protein n=1 Tax=Aulographum hederae CBS 113979 TaxID=1176131 RepID=A0A6G1GSN8_9PEZI|nr:hypothetical protein K402DRAFT_423373 [Aulographum hederae CBS 113979]